MRIVLLPTFIHTQTEILRLTKNSGIRPSIALSECVLRWGDGALTGKPRLLKFFLSVQINVHVGMVARHSSSRSFVHLLESLTSAQRGAAYCICLHQNKP